MGKAFIQASMDINITYDEESAPDKEELRTKLEESINKWADSKEHLLDREIEVYVRGGKKQMAEELTYKLTIFLRLTYEADEVPKGTELREELDLLAKSWASAECDIWKCVTHTIAVNVT